MEREIKFRAWDGNSMSLNVKTIQQLADGEISRDAEKLIWLEFTGLKDEDEKELYDGDILSNGYNSKGAISFSNGKFICEMMYKNSEQTIRFELYNISPVTKKIGNIYENPELLK